MLAKGTNKMIILLIGSPMYRLRNFTLSYNETSIAKTDHKNEISAKNWVGSTWIAKSQLRKKSTVNAGQRSTRADVALADVALGLTCHLGLTWQRRSLARGGACRRVTAHRIFRRRVRARSAADWVVFCVVESIFPRSFQQQWMCLDWSPVAREPRVAASSFGEESASWQRRQPDF